MVSLNNFTIEELLELADVLRTHHFSNVVSYSKNVFVPIINLCRNCCTYCGFRKEPSDPRAKLMLPDEVMSIVKKAEKLGCKEVLFTFGEKPEEKYPHILQRLKKIGNYNSLHEYHLSLCNQVLENTSMLPHSNPGVLEMEELERLKECNASMGLMLECSSERLVEKGGPHEFSPGKHPRARLETIDNAGRLKIPFTTGLLIGIGETLEERIDSLLALKKLHDEHGHIQEIIIQNFVPNEATTGRNFKPPGLKDIIIIILLTRQIFGPKMHVQVPPNLNPSVLPELLRAGIDDWGGISPVSQDYINPDHPWPTLEKLRRVTESNGRILKERLPIYPEFITKEFTSGRIREKIKIHVDESGFVR
ncbi:MAG: 7,8-didemethyl-8-hydroxy-5-deazariboflavin synthase CofG [Candidatus Helarchaeales archaeon]